MNAELRKAALALVERCSVVQLGSVDGEGWPWVKALLKPRENDGLRVFYHSTNSSSLRVAQLTANPKASLYFYDEARFQGLLLLGTMEVLEDQDNKKRIWREGDSRYYPFGVADPDYCVLRFTALRGRYYAELGSADFTLE